MLQVYRERIIFNSHQSKFVSLQRNECLIMFCILNSVSEISRQKLSQSIQATITEHHRLGVLSHNIDFSQSGGGKSKIKAPAASVSGETQFQANRWYPLSVTSHGGNGEGAPPPNHGDLITSQKAHLLSSYRALGFNVLILGKERWQQMFSPKQQGTN